MWQFISVCLVSNKQKWAARASNGHVTHSSVTYLEVKANRENDKEEKEVVLLWDHKNWVNRDMFLQSPASFLFFFFLLQCAELSGEIYSISSRVWMETDFFLSSFAVFKSLSLSPVMTSLFEEVKLPSSVLLVKTEDYGWWLGSSQPQCFSLVWIHHLADVFGLL